MFTLSCHNMEIKTDEEIQMFILTYLKFYQEYFKMVCSI